MQKQKQTKKNVKTNAQQAITPCSPAMQKKFDRKEIGDPVARHGDVVLLKAVLPANAVSLPQKELLRSEITGNVHGILGDATVYSGPGTNECSTGLYVQVHGAAMMQLHLDHKQRPLPVGVCEVTRKREATTESEWRAIAD